MKYDAAKIREVNHGLWRIEESFRIMKSDLDARPIYVNTRVHIRAHFLICFVSLAIIRMIQHHMGEKRRSAERIAEALREANCLTERRGYLKTAINTHCCYLHFLFQKNHPVLFCLIR